MSRSLSMILSAGLDHAHSLFSLFLLELGEGFEHPSLIRWPFEKTALLNYKAYLYRVHGKFYHITDELKEKAVAVNMDSVQFLAGRKEE